MTFLPLVQRRATGHPEDMQPAFAVELEAQHRQLRAVAEAERAARPARGCRPPHMASWRGAAGRGLVTLGVVVALPRRRRRAVVEDAVALVECG
jgi:hypothetical protein